MILMRDKTFEFLRCRPVDGSGKLICHAISHGDVCHISCDAPHDFARLSIDALERHRFVCKAENIISPSMTRVISEEITQLRDVILMMSSRRGSGRRVDSHSASRGPEQRVCVCGARQVVLDTTVDVAAERLTCRNPGVGIVDQVRSDGRFPHDLFLGGSVHGVYVLWCIEDQTQSRMMSLSVRALTRLSAPSGSRA